MHSAGQAGACIYLTNNYQNITFFGKNLVTGRVMQLSNDTSKNSTSPPYLAKNERSLIEVEKRRSVTNRTTLELS